MRSTDRNGVTLKYSRKTRKLTRPRKASDAARPTMRQVPKVAAMTHHERSRAFNSGRMGDARIQLGPPNARVAAAARPSVEVASSSRATIPASTKTREGDRALKLMAAPPPRRGSSDSTPLPGAGPGSKSEQPAPKAQAPDRMRHPARS